ALDSYIGVARLAYSSAPISASRVITAIDHFRRLMTPRYSRRRSDSSEGRVVSEADMARPRTLSEVLRFVTLLDPARDGARDYRTTSPTVPFVEDSPRPGRRPLSRAPHRGRTALARSRVVPRASTDRRP